MRPAKVPNSSQVDLRVLRDFLHEFGEVISRSSGIERDLEMNIGDKRSCR